MGIISMQDMGVQYSSKEPLILPEIDQPDDN